MAAALPVLPAFPVEIAAETLVLVGIELKLVAELHEVYGSPAPGKFPERMSAYVASCGRVPAGPAAAPPARRPRRTQRGLPRPDAHRRRRGRVVQPEGDQEAGPGNPA
jgi:hypothetical protein